MPIRLMVFNWLTLPALLLACALFPFGRMLAAETETTSDDWLFGLEGLFFALPALGYLAWSMELFAGWERFYTIRAVAGTEVLAGTCGLLAGMAAQWTREYRLLGTPGMGVLMIIVILAPQLGPVLWPANFAGMKNEWRDDVCLQSHSHSSGPAAAATILREFGGSTTEADAARRTFTSRKGTEPWYLSRFLRRARLDTEFHLQDPAKGIIVPGIAQVRLPDRMHYLAILGNDTNGNFTVGDPARGRLRLKRETLTNDFRLTGLFLKVRPRR